MGDVTASISIEERFCQVTDRNQDMEILNIA